MITPKLYLSQDEETVKVELYLPYVKVSNSEIDLDSFEFRFNLKPYFLRISFQSRIFVNIYLIYIFFKIIDLLF